MNKKIIDNAEIWSPVFQTKKQVAIALLADYLVMFALGMIAGAALIMWLK